MTIGDHLVGWATRQTTDWSLYEREKHPRLEQRTHCAPRDRLHITRGCYNSNCWAGDNLPNVPINANISCFLIKTTRTLVFSDICAKYVFSPLKQRPLYTCVAPSGTTEEMLVCIFGNPGNAIVCCLNYFTGSRSVICSEETAHQVFSDKSKWVGQPGNLGTWQPGNLAMGNLAGISRLQKCTAGNLGDAIVCPMLENWPKFQTKKTFSRWSLSSVWCIFRPWAKRRKWPRLY